MKILITGAAGFIGMHVAHNLLQNKNNIVIGVDNINNYYDIRIKLERIRILKQYNNFFFTKSDLNNVKKIDNLFKKYNPTIVINLAAQAGVRYSILNPDTYLKSNINGFHNILKNAVKYKVKHLIFASTSSVYGANQTKLNREKDYTETPLSVYAATKKTNENLAHVYSYLYKIKTTGLRFFTVYGPLGRPDMALFKFVKNILNNKTIEIYNNGNMQRSFTYIDDITEAIVKLAKDKKPHSNSNRIPFNIFNIGNNKSMRLSKFVKIIENSLKMKAKKKFLPIQKGDVKATCADTSKLFDLIGYSPKTSVEYGVKKFIEWYKNFYSIK